MELEELAKKYALQNALLHGSAKASAVLGKMLAEQPELKAQMAAVGKAAAEAAAAVNKMPAAEIERKIKKYEFAEVAKEAKRLELPDAAHGAVTTRFAPNPDAPTIHIGNCRALVLSHELAKRYAGRFLLRFEDTDPKVKPPLPEAYDAITRDVEWLGCAADETFVQSERLETYYEHAEELLKKGHAYICTCNVELWREMRDARRACPCRSQASAEALSLWRKMLSGGVREGAAVVRIKTSLALENPALRDWPALRVSNAPHPRAKAHVWPLYNFANAIDDHLMHVTHVLRGKEHLVNEERQRFLYDYFGWKQPVSVQFGRLELEESELSKSKTRQLIAEGVYAGWDDPRLGTVAALRRRGFVAAAIRSAILDLGLTQADITFPMEALESYNRKIVDAQANRYFVVLEPVLLVFDGSAETSAKILLHPGFPQRGEREIAAKKAVMLQKGDYDAFLGKEVRLMDLFNVHIHGRRAVFSGSENKPELKRIHWLSGETIAADVVMPDAGVRHGVAEKALAAEPEGALVQMVRNGFARIDKKEADKITLYFAHR